MIFGPASSPAAAGFDEREFENIFLHGKFPGEKLSSVRANSQRAELWALYDGPVKYNPLNMLRVLRTLWGIHVDLSVGPRSAANTAPRGYVRHPVGKRIVKTYFEGYAGNISDALRSIVSMAPYDHAVASRALSQKFFIRLIVPLKALAPLQKVEALLVAYTLAWVMDERHFAGVVDPDTFLFVPPANVIAGVTNFRRPEQMLNTHLLSGFNFYQENEAYRFFTHGLHRFGMPEALIYRGPKGKSLSRENYAAALKTAHGYFLDKLTGRKMKKPAPLAKKFKLPEQVAAMTGKKVADLPLVDQG